MPNSIRYLMLGGFLGAGKTTTIKMLVGLLRPGSGRVVIDGVDVVTDVRAATQRIGYVPDQPYLYEKLSGREFLHFVAEMHGMPRSEARIAIDREVSRFGLARFADELAESYSHGMKHRSVFAAAMIHDPRVLVVDEPLVGLDPHTGKVDFEFPWRSKKLESVNASGPVVVGNRVFISETYELGSALLQVEPDGYKVVWQDQPRSRERSLELHWNTAIHHNGYLYGSSGRHTGNAQMRCVALDTGRVQWSEPGWGRSSLLYADNHLICLSEDGILRLLKATPQQCEVVSELTLRNDLGIALLKYPAWGAPVLSHGLLYVRGKDRLVCLEVIPTGGP